MSSIARVVLLALHASFFLALTGLAPATITAVASPVPAAWASFDSLLATRVVSKSTDVELAARVPAVSPAASAHPQGQVNQTERMRQYSERAAQYATTMKRLAAKATSHSPRDDVAFQNACTDTLTGFGGLYEQILALLRSIDCRDPDSPTQVYIDQIINANKDIVKATLVLTNLIPSLKPLLDPILYQIKCLVDAVLDLTRGLLDCTIVLLKLGLGSLVDCTTGSLICL
ncbi:hypothetical protein GGX14DRAFT_420807 [Mycena pura]|uniref:Secreted protein n=1 Tax=Mycena pura TaxID=153505 RepID=A0AAD6YPE6_9AGAR|nr:hypothetical protein GGX14DRAFT_420807 [Mycena pura]